MEQLDPVGLPLCIPLRIIPNMALCVNEQAERMAKTGFPYGIQDTQPRTMLCHGPWIGRP